MYIRKWISTVFINCNVAFCQKSCFIVFHQLYHSAAVVYSLLSMNKQFFPHSSLKVFLTSFTFLCTNNIFRFSLFLQSTLYCFFIKYVIIYNIGDLIVEVGKERSMSVDCFKYFFSVNILFCCLLQSCFVKRAAVKIMNKFQHEETFYRCKLQAVTYACMSLHACSHSPANMWHACVIARCASA